MALWKARAYCITAALLWSTSGFLIKKLTFAPEDGGAGWSAWQVAGVRSALAAAFLMCFTPLKARWPTRAHWIIAAFSAPMLLAYVLAQTFGGTADATFLQYTAPVYIILLSPFILKESFRRVDLFCLVAIIAGMLFIIPQGVLTKGGLGTGMGILSGITFAGVVMAMRRWREGAGIAGLAWGNVLVAIIALPVAFFSSQEMIIPTFSSGCIILFLGFFQLSISYILFQRSLYGLTAVQASLYCLIEPLATPIWAFLIISETPAGNTMAGGVVILTTLFIHAMFTKRGLSK